MKLKMLCKYLFDVFFAVILLFVALPVGLVLALVIFVTMGRPVIFTQPRPGKQGKIFKLYKFRTMSRARDANGVLLADAQRLTQLGALLRKYSLDELPQLLNVLKGDLSFVGPRPLLCKYLPLYNETQARRHEVKPGITGWAQVNGRNALTWDEKFAYDIWYVDNQSFGLDLKILFMTVKKVFKASDISYQNNATMPEFTGNKR